MAFAARLGVVKRAQSIRRDMFDFLKEFLIGGAPAGIGKAIALVVESGERFRWKSGCLSARMDCETKQDRGCEDEYQRCGLHRTLPPAARGPPGEDCKDQNIG